MRSFSTIVTFLSFLFISFSANAQDTAKINALNRLAESLQDKYADSALKIAEASLQAARKANYIQGEMIALNNSGWLYYRKGNYKKASEHAFEALAFAEKANDHNEAAKAYNTIGSVYNDQSVPTTSLNFFKLSLEQYKEANNIQGQGRALNNLAYTAYKAKKIDSALLYAQQAYAINSTLPNKYFLAFTLRNLGDIYAEKKISDEALKNFEGSLQIARNIQNNFLAITDLNRIGAIHLEQNDIDSAIHYFTEAEQLGSVSGFRSVLVQPFKGLSVAYARKGAFETAYRYSSRFSALNDSLKDAANTETIAILQSNYEQEKQQAEIALQKAKLAEQKQFIATLVIVVVLTLLFAVFLFRRYNFEKKFSKKINEQATQLTMLNAALTNNLSFKNKVLSILSHDLRGPLSALTGTMQLLDNNALSSNEYSIIRERLGKQLSSLNLTLDNVLNWAMSQTGSVEANKQVLDLHEIAEHNISLLENSALQKNIRFNNNILSNIKAHADAIQISLVVRNLIANAIKFSYANSVIDLSSEEKENEVIISIRDHGKGIPEMHQPNVLNSSSHYSTYGTENEKGTGIGLILCQEFIELNHGKIWFTSEENKGTCFSFSLPKFVA